MDGTVPIILDRPRLLRLGVNALRLAEPLQRQRWMQSLLCVIA
jgi:hypothetical protein